MLFRIILRTFRNNPVQMFSPNGNAYQYQPNNHRHSARLDSSEADDEQVGSRQPLYANAPPKPKRLNTSRDRESPSPERLVYQVTEEPAPLVTAMYQQPHSGNYFLILFSKI